MSAVLLFASTAASMAAESARLPVEVPSGAKVWLQEELTDRVPGMGLIQRYRFVMPALNDLVPPVSESDITENLPADMIDEGPGPDIPLTPAEQAELDQALGELVIEAGPDEGGTGQQGGGAAKPGLPGDGGIVDAPLPSELAAPDAQMPAGDGGSDSEAMGDLAAVGGGVDDPALPAAPDVLMQDPVHRDIVALCEKYALPRVKAMSPQPVQVVISVASAATPFGSFDPSVVQLFEGFRIPADRNACIWEPM